jgi:hypothetical protein
MVPQRDAEIQPASVVCGRRGQRFFRLLTGGLLVRVQPEEPTLARTYGHRRSGLPRLCPILCPRRASRSKTRRKSSALIPPVTRQYRLTQFL